MSSEQVERLEHIKNLVNAAMQITVSDAMMIEHALHDKGYPRDSTVRNLLRDYQRTWRGETDG